MTTMPRKPISQYHPALYFIAVWLRRLHRYVAWYGDGRRYAAAQSTEKLAYQVKKHQMQETWLKMTSNSLTDTLHRNHPA